jgi:hypothetical protein
MLTVAFVAAGSPNVLGMTLREVEMVCPYNGTKFTAALQSSGTIFTNTLDLMPVGAIMSPSPLAECPTNGFVFFKREFTPEELERLKPLVLSPEYQALAGETSYYRAAWLQGRSGASHLEVTWTLLGAKWQRAAYAPEVLARLPQDIAEAEGELKATLRIVEGDLLRQLGRFDESRQRFSSLLDEFDADTVIGTVARYELVLIDKGDGSSQHTIESAMDHFKTAP